MLLSVIGRTGGVVEIGAGMLCSPDGTISPAGGGVESDGGAGTLKLPGMRLPRSALGSRKPEFAAAISLACGAGLFGDPEPP